MWSDRGQFWQLLFQNSRVYNQSFSDVFSGYRNGKLGQEGLKGNVRITGAEICVSQSNSKLSMPSCQKRSESTVTGQTKRAFVASRKMSDDKD